MAHLTPRELASLRDQVARARRAREEERRRSDARAGELAKKRKTPTPTFLAVAAELERDPSQGYRKIAAAVGVTHTTVKHIRRQLEAEGVVQESQRRDDSRKARA